MNGLTDTISRVKIWFTLQSGAVPYIIGFGLRQWTQGIAERYPENILMTFAGMRFTRGGSVSYFIADREEYDRSFRKLLAHPETFVRV